MPSKRAAKEWLDFEIKHGRGEESCHIVDVSADQRERIANKKRKQNFVLCTGDPDMCSQFELEKDRIFQRVKNKAIAMELMHQAWRDALSNGVLDVIMAQLDAVESGAPKPPRAEIPS